MYLSINTLLVTSTKQLTHLWIYGFLGVVGEEVGIKANGANNQHLD